MSPAPALSPLRAVFAAGVLAALLALAGCGGSHVRAVHVPVRGVPLESILETGQVYTDPAGTLPLLRRLGVDLVRMDISWNTVAPEPTSPLPPSGFHAADPAAYSPAAWSVYDTIVRDARAARIAVDLTLDPPPPLWAGGRGAPPRSGSLAAEWRPSAAQFGAFVRAVGKRYSGTYVPPGSRTPLPRVSFWSVWNEPNYGPDLAPQAIDNSTVEVSPMLYRGLLDAAWLALGQTGHGADSILIGELAPRGQTVGDQPGNFSGMVPLRFVRALYCVDSALAPLRGAAASARGCPTDAAGSAAFRRLNPPLFHASGFSVHPYPQAFPPDVATPGEPDYADLPQLPKLESTLDRAQQVYGSRARLPIYSTEFGYKTNPPIGVPAPTAALYLNWAEYLSWRDPRVRSYDQYLLTDPPAAASGFATGLQFADGKPKPSFYAYRMPLYLPIASAPRGQALEVWGCVRPARFARIDTGRRQVVEIQFQAGGRGAFRTLDRVELTDPYGYFDVSRRFPGSGAVRLKWSYPDGTTIFSRSTDITIR